MKRVLSTIIAVLPALALFCSCEKEIEFKGDFDGEKLVLYTTANTESEMYAILSHSRFIIGSRPQGTGDDSVSGADVTAEINGRTIKMTDDGSGVYLSGYTPEPGDVITVKANKKGYAPVSATTVVPQKAAFSVDNVEISVDNEYATMSYSVKIWKVKFRFTINDPAGEQNYYRIRTFYRNGEYINEGYALTKDILYYNTSGLEGEIDAIENAINGDTEIYIPEYLDDSVIDGQIHTTEAWFTVCHSVEADDYWDRKEDGEGEDVEPEIPEVEPLGPEDVWIEIDAISPDLYKYCVSLDMYRSTQSGLGSFFGEAVSIHNNVAGGIGCVGSVTPGIIFLHE